MKVPTNNLLLNLFYRTWKKDENFHTEALIHLLQYLIESENETKPAINILNVITKGRLDLSPEQIKSLKINTQVTTITRVRPDIKIETLDHLIYVEVKVNSELGNLQLWQYRNALNASGFDRTSLVLLTKYPFLPKEGDEKPDVVVRWYEIAECLEDELERKAILQPLSIYLIQQFLGFLEGRGLTMERVSKELVPGIQSLLNLLIMLEEALKLVRVSSIRFGIELEWVGYHFKSDSQQYWVGLRYDRPGVLFVEIDEIDPLIYRKLSLGDVAYLNGYEYEYWYWIYELDLSSDVMGFFELPKSKQLQCIEQFLQKSLDAVKQLSV